ncbi:MAG: discoidin domain-containing protein, partial [Phycisphaerales bacterium]|nr:discoidin domain-containing protein [Phycisphaerales bacterium]
MHRRLTFAALFFCLLSCVLLAKPGKTKVSKKKQSKATPAAPKTFNQQLRADYLKQLSLRFKPTKTVKTWTQSSAHKALDAAGGCDGIINGGYGFHTSENASPWWQVDLGSVKAIDVVRVYNRCDNKSAPARMAKLQIKVSTNGKSWTTAFKNDGTVFGGKPDGKPLNAKLNDAKGRYVRLQL